MDGDGPTEECEVCGGTDFYKEAGHFYCNECQTQSQQIREQVFEQEEATINKKSTKKIQKERSSKTEDKLTSWECFNVILKGLTEELIGLGAKPELKVVVRCLWMKYLHKCEVFDVKSDRPPKVSVLGSKKDIAILYSVKKRKRRRSRTSSTSTTLSVRRQRSNKRRALIHSQYEGLLQSQTQESSMMEETLSSVKSGTEKTDGEKISYNRYSNAELKNVMSKKHRKEHNRDVEGEMSCHKFRVKDFPSTFARGPTVLTSFTLYSILYIGLLIIQDSLQLSDMFRFIREGHLSFYSYRHFFGDDISDKSLSLPRRNDKLFGNEHFRKKTIKLVHFLDVAKYIKMPNLVHLCSRYCAELNLPKEIVDCVEKLIAKTNPQMPFSKKSTELPNYEGRAISFIVFTLKLLFGLDGVTENKLSVFAKLLNDIPVDIKMFNFLEWLKHLGYRDAVVGTYHMPSSLQNSNNVDSDMYLEYFKSQEINFETINRHIQSEAKDYLQVLDKVLEDGWNRGGELRFNPSLTPFKSYVEVILDAKEIGCEDVLRQSFGEDSVSFLLRPNKYLKLLGNSRVKNGGANDNIVTEDPLHLYKETCARRIYNNTVTVKISGEIQSDSFIREYLDSDEKSLRTTDVDVLLSNWQKGNEKKFIKNRTLLQLASEHVEVNDGICTADSYPENYNNFERYWLNIPANPTVVRYFSKSRTQEIVDKLSHSFKLILKDCTRIAEQDMYVLYAEFLVTELNLVHFGEYCSKGKKVRGGSEIRKVLKDCLNVW